MAKSNGRSTNGPDADGATRKLRSRAWFDNPANPDMTALYLERYLNFGLTLDELQSDKPIIGMTILWGLKKDGDSWAGGEILDPHNGKTYRCKMTLSDDGKSLNVRGFIGISLIGRSQIWWREQ